MSANPYYSARLPEETWPDNRATTQSFFGAPLCPDLEELDAQVAFLGVPYDLGGTTPGSRYGPKGIRETRVYSCGGYPLGNGEKQKPLGYYDLDTDRQCLQGVTMADCGDVAILPADIERNSWRITRTVREIVARLPLLVAVGGDHSVTSFVVRGFDSYPALDIVHFDAHHDFLDHVQGIRWSNGCPIRRASEYPWVRNITQIGLRQVGPAGRAVIDDARARGNRIITADQFRDMGPEATMAVVPQSEAIYVTIDIDVMDPSICPGTQAPEPGGFTYLEMRAALRSLAARGRIVGIDLVEVSPQLDPTGVTSKTGARLLIDFLTAITDGQERQLAE